MMSFTIASTNKLTNAKINHSQLFKNIVKRKRGGRGPRKRRKNKTILSKTKTHNYNAQKASTDKC